MTKEAFIEKFDSDRKLQEAFLRAGDPEAFLREYGCEAGAYDVLVELFKRTGTELPDEVLEATVGGAKTNYGLTPTILYLQIHLLGAYGIGANLPTSGPTVTVPSQGKVTAVTAGKAVKVDE